MTMDHDRCSELLAAYVDGELDASTMDGVGTHLQGCPDCRLEETALQAMAAIQVTPMSADERSWLHEQVLAGAKAAEEPETATVIVPRRAPWFARVAPALGAVATLLVIAVGTMLIGGNLNGDDGGQAASGGTGGADRSEADSAEEGPAATARSSKAGTDDGDNAVAGAQEYTAENLAGKNARPRFVALGDVQERTLRMIGRRDATFDSYSSAFSVADVTPHQQRLLDQLVRRSPPSLESQIRECAQTVFENGPPASLPAFAATAERDNRDILVLGFAWSDKERGPVYRYMMWSWPLGGDCEHPIGYEAGRITNR